MANRQGRKQTRDFRPWLPREIPAKSVTIGGIPDIEQAAPIELDL